jgi:hypothetical protein
MRHRQRDVLRDPPRDRHLLAPEEVHALRPELQPELLIARRQADRQYRAVASRDDPFPVIGRIVNHVRHVQGEVVDHLEEPVHQSRRIHARRAHRRRPIVVRRRVQDEAALLAVMERHGEAVVRQDRLRDLRDPREDVPDVEHARQHPQQLLRRLEVRLARPVHRCSQLVVVMESRWCDARCDHGTAHCRIGKGFKLCREAQLVP